MTHINPAKLSNAIKLLMVIGLIAPVTLVAQAKNPTQKQEKVEMELREQNKKIVASMLQHLEEMNIPAWQSLWSDDASQEMPFAPEGFPKKLEGMTVLYNQYKSLPENFRSMKFSIEHLETLADPEWVVAEYKGLIELKNGGHYDNSYISLAHIKNGKIVLLREYFNPIVLQNAFGQNLQKNFNVRGSGK